MELARITAQQVLILFVMILTGAVCFRSGLIKEDGKRVLSDILLYLISPAMLIDSYMVEFDPATFHNLLMTFVLSGVLLLLGLAVSFIFTWKLKSPNIVILRFACTFSNAGYMGFPLIRALFGEEGILYASAFLTMFNLLLWTQGYVMTSGKARPREIAVSIASCPSIIAVVSGLLIYLLRIPVSEIIKSPISMIGDMNTPVSMIVIGLTIAGSDIRRLLKSRELGVVILLRLFVTPLIGALLFFVLGVHGMVPMIALILEACPCAAITTMFAIKFNHSQDLAAGSVVITTLLSIITLPLYSLILSAMVG